MKPDDPLSRRERQILDILYARSQATVAEVLTDLPDPPGYNSVRKILTILEVKGHVTHREEGIRFVYAPAQPRQSAARGALDRVVATFFHGSAARAAHALLGDADNSLTSAELTELETLIRAAKERKTDDGTAG